LTLHHERNDVTHWTKTYTRTSPSEQVELEFTEAQARSIDTVLEPEGLGPGSAQKLVDKWNREARLTRAPFFYTL
jgi:hypothetical protein